MGHILNFPSLQALGKFKPNLALLKYHSIQFYLKLWVTSDDSKKEINEIQNSLSQVQLGKRHLWLKRCRHLHGNGYVFKQMGGNSECIWTILYR